MINQEDKSSRITSKMNEIGIHRLSMSVRESRHYPSRDDLTLSRRILLECTLATPPINRIKSRQE
jgi:hypothetical protein